LVFKAGDYVICDEDWDPATDTEMVANQIQTYFRLAQSLIESLKNEQFEIAFEEPIRNEELYEEEDFEVLTEEQKDEVLNKKNKIIDYFCRSLA